MEVSDVKQPPKVMLTLCDSTGTQTQFFSEPKVPFFAFSHPVLSFMPLSPKYPQVDNATNNLTTFKNLGDSES